MEKIDIENTVRTFLTEDVMKEEAKSASISDPIDFDSLEEVEINMFIEEEFNIILEKIDKKFTTIGEIMDFIHVNL